MTPERDAYRRGARACRRGLPPSVCPHDQIRLAAAWVLGWHQAAGQPPAAIIAQAWRAGVLPDLKPRGPAA